MWPQAPRPTGPQRNVERLLVDINNSSKYYFSCDECEIGMNPTSLFSLGGEETLRGRESPCQ